MATITDLRTQLRDWTNEPSTILTDAVCDELVNTALREMQRAHGWRGMEVVSGDLAYAANAASIALPADFVAERVVYWKDPNQPTPSEQLWPLERRTREEWFERAVVPLGSQDQVYPQIAAPGGVRAGLLVYAIFGGQVFLFPTPTTAQTVVLDYYARLPDLAAGTNPSNVFSVEYPDVLRAGALAEIYGEYLQMPEEAAVWRAKFLQKLDQAVKHDQTLAASGRRVTRGR